MNVLVVYTNKSFLSNPKELFIFQQNLYSISSDVKRNFASI